MAEASEMEKMLAGAIARSAKANASLTVVLIKLLIHKGVISSEEVNSVILDQTEEEMKKLVPSDWKDLPEDEFIDALEARAVLNLIGHMRDILSPE